MHYKQRCHLTMRTGGRLETHSVHAKNTAKRTIHNREHLTATVYCVSRLQRVYLGETIKACSYLIYLWIVLHGAGAKRIRSVLHTMHQTGKSGIVAHNLNLWQFRQQQIRFSATRRSGYRHINFWQSKLIASRLAKFK